MMKPHSIEMEKDSQGFMLYACARCGLDEDIIAGDPAYASCTKYSLIYKCRKTVRKMRRTIFMAISGFFRRLA